MKGQSAKLLAIFVFTGMAIFPAWSATIYVDDDFDSTTPGWGVDHFDLIQDGIDAAQTGDEVLVSEGTYLENVDFLGKAITVMSAAGPARTIIDGSNPASSDFESGAIFKNDEGPDSVLEGFTILNGEGSKCSGYSDRCGGGIYCFGASPTIRGNIVTANKARYGGGIFCYDSAAWIDGNTITLNNNTAMQDGGGVYCRADSTTDFPTITGNVISFNETDHWGGGIYCLDSNAVIANNVIFRNVAKNRGGAIACRGTSAPLIVNNTIVANSADDNTGGIHCQDSAAPSITNTILWANTAPEIGDESSNDPTATYCDIENGTGQPWFGAGCIDENPLFVEEAVDDYHLTWTSSCKDTGDSTASGLPAIDFEGDPRPALAAADMGADEFYYHLYAMGAVAPGGTISRIRAIGGSGMAVALYMSTSLQDPPQSTSFGDLYLTVPFEGYWRLGQVGADGLLTLQDVPVPGAWNSGEIYYFQALIGSWHNPYTAISNVMTLEVE